MPPKPHSPTSDRPRSILLGHGLIWPQLFATISLGVRPGRVFLGLVLALSLWAAGALPSMWIREEPTPMQRAVELGAPVTERLIDAMARLDIQGALESVRFLLIDLPGKVAGSQPWSTAASLLLALLVWALLGGAIARSTATEFALRQRVSTRQSLVFSISRLRSTAAALATPVTVVALLALLLSGLGAIAASSTIAGGVLAIAFVLVLGLSLCGVLALLGFVLGLPLLVSAVVCEGTDAIDSLQRTFAYVLGRPVRLVLYSAVLYVQVMFTALVSSALVSATAAFALRWFFAPESSERLSHISSFARDAQTAWLMLFTTLAGGVVLSVFHSGSAVLYLLLRQANDGQDPADLWQPGVAEAARAALRDNANEKIAPDQPAEDEDA